MRLENKAIVVTGASSGMGKSIVELFVKEGASVIAVARRADRLASLAESLAGEAGKIIPFTGDVSKKEDCEAMIDACIKEFGMTSEEFATRLLEEEKVAAVPGTAFGDSGEGFLRISYAYSLDRLKLAMEKIGHFVDKLRKEQE